MFAPKDAGNTNLCKRGLFEVSRVNLKRQITATLVRNVGNGAIENPLANVLLLW